MTLRVPPRSRRDRPVADEQIGEADRLVHFVSDALAMSRLESGITPDPQWNALGEIVSQTDAKSQITTFGYDLLGRTTSRVEPEGTSTFMFGTSAAAKNIGRLAGMSGPGYSEGYTYDSIGRLQQRSITSERLMPAAAIMRG